jgi:hypothetical protein
VSFEEFKTKGDFKVSCAQAVVGLVALGSPVLNHSRTGASRALGEGATTTGRRATRRSVAGRWSTLHLPSDRSPRNVGAEISCPAPTVNGVTTSDAEPTTDAPESFPPAGY